MSASSIAARAGAARTYNSAEETSVLLVDSDSGPLLPMAERGGV